MILVLIALVPGHCLSFTFSVRTLNVGVGVNSNKVYFFSTVTPLDCEHHVSVRE